MNNKRKRNPHCSQRELATKFKISLGTINRILSNKEKLLQIDDNRNKRQRKLLKTNVIDSTLFKWFVSRRHMHHSISGDSLKIMALKLAESANIFNFCASTEWLNSFRNRYNIKSKFLIGESGFVPESLIDNFKPIYEKKLKKYNSDNIFNCDETDVYEALLSINQVWREVSNTTISNCWNNEIKNSNIESSYKIDFIFENIYEEISESDHIFIKQFSENKRMNVPNQPYLKTIKL
ncbi:hypothetical protein A3Q56_00825 [Intoshia linei]|uniref:HTH CENPB-type domain-containing protein n=1 Tax=Intoshia linei TaxID=1819745 RepID=A0A177BAQ5_9BILA|nr:hypothetical protein A3Q56_00825 [Intoshia linei]